METLISDDGWCNFIEFDVEGSICLNRKDAYRLSLQGRSWVFARPTDDYQWLAECSYADLA